MARTLDAFTSHIYGVKDGAVVHLYLDISRMRKRLINLRSDGSRTEHIVPLAHSPTAEAERFFGFSDAVEIYDPDTPSGQQQIAELDSLLQSDDTGADF